MKHSGAAVTAADRMAAAMQLALELPGRREQAHEDRCLPQATVDALREAGLLRLLQPSCWGGAEAPLQELIDLQAVLARQCVSTAWVFGVLNVQSFMLSLFDPRAQEDVWAATPLASLSSSFMPMGQARRVEGGFCISGQWPYSSGCMHAQWALLGAMVPGEAPDSPPTMRVLLVPRQDTEVVDTWHTFGLRGTGSHDLRLQDVFVPAHRSWAPPQGLLPAAGQSAHEGALFRMPWLYVFTTAVAAVGIGSARGAVDAFVETTKARRVAVPAQKPIDPAVLRQVGQAHAELEDLDAALRRGVARMTHCAQAAIEQPHGGMGAAEAWQHRTVLTSLVRRSTGIVDGLMPSLGARSVLEAHPVTRFWLDLCAARAHPGNDPAAASQELASLLMA